MAVAGLDGGANGGPEGGPGADVSVACAMLAFKAGEAVRDGY